MALDDGIVRWLKEYIVASFIDMVCVVGPNQTVPIPMGQRNALHLVSTAIDSQAWHFQKFDNPPSAKQPPAKYAGYGCQATQFGDFPSLSLSLALWLSLTCLSQRACHPTAEGGHFEYICRVRVWWRGKGSCRGGWQRRRRRFVDFIFASRPRIDFLFREAAFLVRQTKCDAHILLQPGQN